MSQKNTAFLPGWFSPRQIPGFFLLALMLLPALLQAADIKVTASLDSRQFTMDEAGLLTVTVTGSSDAKPVRMPHGKGLEITYQGRSSSMQWVNGKSSSSVAFSFEVTGLQPGEHIIDPVEIEVDGVRYRSGPVKCTVLPAGARTGGGGKAIKPPSSGTAANDTEADRGGYIRILPKKNKLYVGEQIPVTIQVYLRRDVQWEGLKSAPRIPAGNFMLESLDENPEQRVELVNGVPYTLVSWQGILSAIKQGDFPLQVEIDATMLKRIKRRNPSRFGASPFNDPFFDNFFGGLGSFSLTRKDLTLVSPKQKVTVRDLPEQDKPSCFSGAIGTFSMAVSAAPTTVQPGDPITLKMKVQGTGNFSRVHAPVFPESTDWKTYPPSTVENGDNTSDSKTFEQAVIPVNPNVNAIPSLCFAYFDPDREQYITMESDPIPINLEGGGVSSGTILQQTTSRNQGSRVKQNVPTTAKNSAPSVPLMKEYGRPVTVLVPLYRKIWFQALLALAVISLLAGIILLIRKQRKNRDPIRYAKKALARELDTLIRQAEQAMLESDSARFLQTCRVILQKRYGFTLNMASEAVSGADLTTRLGKESPAAAILTQAEHAVYTGEQVSQQEMETILSAIKEDRAKL